MRKRGRSEMTTIWELSSGRVIEEMNGVPIPMQQIACVMRHYQKVSPKDEFFFFTGFFWVFFWGLGDGKLG